VHKRDTETLIVGQNPDSSGISLHTFAYCSFNPTLYYSTRQ